MAATSSNSTSRAYEYEVFMSFRGPDTRLTFTDCLYQALVGNGVFVFRDSEELHYGDKIVELLRAVSHSQILVVVLSKGYASSVWCLREIEHAVNLLESTGTPKILPIFLDVTANDVKLRTALYIDALNEHEEKHGHDQVERWKAALRMVATFRGWEGQGQGYGKLIRSIVGEILTMVKKREKFVTDLVGIDERVNDIMKLLDIDSQDVRFIGIHGMGGIGKTTLAKLIFNKLCGRFEKCSFVSDVRELVNKKGLVYLQKKLSRDLYDSNNVDSNVTDIDEGRTFIQRRACLKTVLIVLDDIDKNEQLINLVGDSNSLGLGSRVLITTRDKGILTVRGIITYEVNHLNFDQALKLFSMHAFKGDSPPYGYRDLSNEVVSKTGGLPLTLSVIGSHLHNKGKEIWRETLDMLGKTLPREVLKKLMISYNALSANEKCIFLDIACFFIREKKTRAMDVWEACGLYPRIAIEVLTNKSLIKINDEFKRDGDGDGYIWMHDQLRDLGRRIIFQENPKDMARRSRLWNHEETLHIVRSKKRKAKVEALVLDECVITAEELESLPNLRFLELKAGTFVGDFKNHTSKLKCIYWRSSPRHPLSLIYSLTNLYLRELVHFELSNCIATNDWGGWNLFKVVNKIKVLVLKNCTGLTKTLDFSNCHYLERLSVDGCSNIQVVDSSIRKLKKLVSLFLRRCERLEELPECIGELISLEHLNISSTKIFELPYSIKCLKQLRVLKMDYCLIRKLPATIGELKSLEELHAMDCYRLEGKLPSEIGKLSFLRILRLSNTRICAIPSTINLLTHLEELHLDCDDFQELPKLPSSLKHLWLSSWSLQSVLDLSNINSLVKLHILTESQEVLMPTSNTVQTCLLPQIGRTSKLEELTLRLPIISAASGELGEFSKTVSSWISNLKCLTKLVLLSFPIFEIQLNKLEMLRQLEIQDCKLLEALSMSSNLRMLERLFVFRCPLLRVIEGVNELEALRSLTVSECGSLEELIDIKSTKIKDDCSLIIWRCEKLLKIDAEKWSFTLADYKKTVISSRKKLNSRI